MRAGTGLAVVVLTAATLAVGCVTSMPNRSASVLSAPAPLPQVQTLVKISGVVVEESGDTRAARRPLAGADISVVIQDEPSLNAVTNDEGRYDFFRKPGKMTVIATKDGYRSEVRTVEFSDALVLNFTLKRVEGKFNARPPAASLR